MSNLRHRVIRLASMNPELRPHLLPLLKRASTELADILAQQDAALTLRYSMFREIEAIHKRFTEDDEGTFQDMWKDYPVMTRVIEGQGRNYSIEGLENQVDLILEELDKFEAETVKNPRYNNSHRIPVSEIREAQDTVRSLRTSLRTFVEKAREWEKKKDRVLFETANRLEQALEGSLYNLHELTDIADRYGLSNRDRSEYIFDRDPDYQTLHDLGLLGWRCKSLAEMKAKAQKANKELDKFVRDILEAHSDQTPASSYKYKIDFMRDEIARGVEHAEELTQELAAARKV